MCRMHMSYVDGDRDVLEYRPYWRIGAAKSSFADDLAYTTVHGVAMSLVQMV